MRPFILKYELIRYIINGVVATGVHYIALNLILLLCASAGCANFIGSFFGITASFLGSRYFVYQGHTGTFGSQVLAFVLLYLSIALLHGLILYVWTDVYRLSHHIGFILATFVQVLISYVGNKMLVFKK